MDNKAILNSVKIDSFMSSVIYKNGLDALIVGSLSLNLLGVTDGIPHDVDLEVKLPSKDKEDVFKLLSSQYGNTYHNSLDYNSNLPSDKMTWTNKPYIFEWRGVKYNIWIVEKFSHEYITLSNGLKVAKAMSVINTKMSYNRIKDIRFISELAKKLLNLIK